MHFLAGKMQAFIFVLLPCFAGLFIFLGGNI